MPLCVGIMKDVNECAFPYTKTVVKGLNTDVCVRFTEGTEDVFKDGALFLSTQ